MYLTFPVVVDQEIGLSGSRPFAKCATTHPLHGIASAYGQEQMEDIN